MKKNEFILEVYANNYAPMQFVRDWADRQGEGHEFTAEEIAVVRAAYDKVRTPKRYSGNIGFSINGMKLFQGGKRKDDLQKKRVFQ